MKRPSKKQFELLAHLDTFIKEHGYGPSYREIMVGMEYRSVATVAAHIKNLVELGYIAKKDKSARSLYVVHSGLDDKIELQTNLVKPADEKWLVSRIDALLSDAEAMPDEAKLNNVYILVGALKVLSLDGAAQGFMPRLKLLRDSIKSEV